MLLVIANDIAPAVRGRMKLWFIEVKPGVFISGISNTLGRKVVDYLLEQRFGADSLLFESLNIAPGYKIYPLGVPDYKLVTYSGLQLIEKYKI